MQYYRANHHHIAHYSAILVQTLQSVYVLVSNVSLKNEFQMLDTAAIWYLLLILFFSGKNLI